MKKILFRNICLSLILVMILSLLSGLIPDTVLSSDLKDSPILENSDVLIFSDDYNVLDCPGNIESMTVDRTVIQIINNTFYKWNEYNLDTEDKFCIQIVEPYEKALNKEEARELLISSQAWVMQSPEITENTTKLKSINSNNVIDDALPVITSAEIFQSGDNIAHGESIEKILTEKTYQDLNPEFVLVTNPSKSSDLEISNILKESQSQLDEGDPVVFDEVEPNNSIAMSDYVNSSYSGEPTYEINGSITNTFNDLDYFQFDVSVSGTFELVSYWINDLVELGYEDYLLVSLTDLNGDIIAASTLYGSGAGEYTKLNYQVEPGTYYILVMAADDLGDYFVNKSYESLVKFYKNIDPPIRVLDTSNFPFNPIGYVTNRYSNGSSYRGTGFLVSSYTILTNGHNVYNPSRGGYVEYFDFTPGQYQLTDGGDLYTPYGYKEAFSIETNSSYISTQEFPYDYAAAHFTHSFSGISTFMPIEFDYTPTYINIAGYPAEVLGNDSRAMWYSSGEVVPTTTETLLCFNAYASGGSSGSPVWEYNSSTGLRRVVSILAFGAELYNGGPRFTLDNQAIIEEWMQWQPESFTVRFYDYDETLLKEELVLPGEAATAPTEPERIGYTFTSWDLSFDTVTDNIDIHATYVVNQYSVNFNVDGGTPVIPITQNYGTTIELPPETEKEGYFVEGWYTDSLFSELITFPYTINEPATLYAKWTNDYDPAVFEIKVYRDGIEAETIGLGEFFDVTVSIVDSGLPISVFAIPIHFDSTVAEVWNTEDSLIVSDGVKTDVEIANGLAGITLGNAFDKVTLNEEETDFEYWAGDFLYNNNSYPYVSNSEGLIKTSAANFSAGVINGRQTVFTIRFRAISEGNPDIRFANSEDLYNDPTSPEGPSIFDDSAASVQHSESIPQLSIVPAYLGGYLNLEAKSDGHHDAVTISITNGIDTYETTSGFSGSFIFTGISEGTYSMSLSIEGYLMRTVSNISFEGSTLMVTDEISPIVLLAGDIDGQTGIDTGDLAYLISKLGLIDSAPGYDSLVDFDDVTGIDTGDLAIIIKNLGLTTEN